MSFKERMVDLDGRLSAPFKIVMPLLLAIVTAAFYLHGAITDLKELRRDSWTLKNQDYFTTNLRSSNTNLSVPTVADALRHEREAVR